MLPSVVIENVKSTYTKKSKSYVKFLSTKMSRTKVYGKSKNKEKTLDEEIEINDSSSTDLADWYDTDDGEEIDETAMNLINIREATPSDYDEFSQSSSHNFSETFPPTNLVLRLHPSVHVKAVKWLVGKIQESKKRFGAGLLVKCEPFSWTQHEEPKEIILHVTANSTKFLEVAEFLEFKKVDDRGLLREFKVRDLDSFLHQDILLETLLTPAEKELVVLNELQSMRALPGEASIPGYPHTRLHSGQAIFHLLVAEGIINSYYPLHDEQELGKLLRTNWIKAFFTEQPFEQLRIYFGEAITLYFTFTSFYTLFLLFPSTISFLLSLVPAKYLSDNVEICLISLINLILVTFLLKLWKRKCSELTYSWGTLNQLSIESIWEEPRVGYLGKMGLDPVTFQYQPRYPGWKTARKVWLVSAPFVMFCMYLSYLLVVCLFTWEEWLTPYKQTQQSGQLWGMILQILGPCIYGITIAIMTNVYRKLAREMTNWENHRTETQYEHHYVAKLIAFEFVNNFVSYFYLAFVLQDLQALKRQLVKMMFIMHLIAVLQQVVLPLVMRGANRKFKQFLERHKSDDNETKASPTKLDSIVKLAVTTNKKKIASQNPDQKPLTTKYTWPSPSKVIIYDSNYFGLLPLSEDDPRIEMNKFEGTMEPYDVGCLFDDYLQIFIQFGHVFMFSPLFPLSSGVAFGMNILFLWASVYKLCSVFQRATPKRVKDIGSWQSAFEALAYISVISNVGLIVLCAEVKSTAMEIGWNEEQFFYGLLIMQNLVMGLRLFINKVIPNVPNWVKIANARVAYQSRMAYKKEQSLKSRRRISMRYQPINANTTTRH